MRNKKLPSVKSLDPNAKPVKYFLARQRGMTKKDAKLEAGYSLATPTTDIETTQPYKSLAYKDILQKEISMQEIASINARNIRQEKDVGGSNTAIKLALDKIEPEQKQEDDDRMVIILKQ